MPEPEPLPLPDMDDEEVDEPQPVVPGQPTAHSKRVQKGAKKVAGPEVNGNVVPVKRARKTSGAAPRKRKVAPPPGPMV